ncbi:pyruvate kinase [Patescibacteria group bacterium]
MDVIATIWKKPYSQKRNQHMIDAGVDCFRVKCSHLPVDDIFRCLMSARQHLDSVDQKVKLLVDLPEAKIRIGEFPQEKAELEAGEEFLFSGEVCSISPDLLIPIKMKNVAAQLYVGDRFYVGDGQLCFEVTKIINQNQFRAKNLNPGQLIQCSSLAIPKLADKLDHFTAEFDQILPLLSKCRPEMVAVSFVSSADMLIKFRHKLKPFLTHEWEPMILAKIESAKGVENIDEILDVSEGIIVARGDLGLNMPYQELGLIQKRLVAKARQKGKYVIVATQMPQSLLNNYLPMRSDILDITNACLDGVSAIMFDSGTAQSKTSERVVQVAKEIIWEIQKN